MNLKIFIPVFLLLLALSVLLAWLAGYDFDTRDMGVAYYFGGSVFFSALGASAVCDYLRG